MAVVLEKTSKSVLLKLTIKEYNQINNFGIFDDEKIDDYDFVFDKPIKASDLLKTF